MKALISILFIIITIPVFAAGQDTTTTPGNFFWPEKINSMASFDHASCAEIIVFANELSEVARQNQEALKKNLNIKRVNMTSVEHVRKKLLAYLVQNWNTASASCTENDFFCKNDISPHGKISERKKLENKIPSKYREWYNHSRVFYRKYAYELIRLAALFPTVTSEIETFSDIEKDGFELNDRQFHLTFDDGPTGENGNTDKLLALLSEADIHASFFMLGEKLKKRLKQSNQDQLARLFQGQCVSLHGWQHQSHARWDKWKESVITTRDLIKSTFPEQYHPWFRPPYGQRKADSDVFFRENNLNVSLWNIDSKDWNRQFTAKESAMRVFKLMLVWRRGVILFHDIHPKALEAIPILLEQTHDTGIEWKNCEEC